MRQHHLTTLCICLLLAACGGDKTAAGHAKTGEEGLPLPDAASGSVTGMPNPGTPSAPPPPLPEVPAEDDVSNINGNDGAAFDPNLPVAPPATPEIHENPNPPEMIPSMPAPAPDPVESRVIPPPES